MNRVLILAGLLAVAAGASACAVPVYEPEPTSVYQWERRQEATARQYAERQRLCRITKDDDPRKEELCRGVEREND
jgi:hypothetical protein